VVCYNNIIVFSDSLTDDGNDYKYSGFPPSPPYWKGRFSDGPTWLEQVAKEFNGIPVINRGFGGSTTNNSYLFSTYNNYTVPSLNQMVTNTTDLAPYATKESLYIIFTGHNDIVGLLYPEMYTVNKNYTVDTIVDNILGAIDLIKKTYNGSQFLVISCIPVNHAPALADAPDKSIPVKIKGLINELNQQLFSKLPSTVKTLDFHAWFENAYTHPGRFGLRTDNGPCVSVTGNSTTVCSNPGSHFYFDSFHPEKKVHQAWGKWAAQQIRKIFPHKR
jgi:phospholipase/lecithinase/hemolysin